MSTVSAQISLRPLRIGFLVDPTDREAISRALRTATCLWGGMMCPLIPVMKRLPPAWRGESFRRPTPTKITRGYLQFFEPDAFVQTADGQFESAGLSTNKLWRDRSRFRSINDLVETEPGREPYIKIGVSSHHVYQHLFMEEFQFKKRRDPRILMFNGGDRIGTAFFEACYGMFPAGDDLDYIPRCYQQAFEAETTTPSVEAWHAIERREAGYPLYYTIRGIDQRFERSWDETIFIFDPLHPGDVIDFWNARLFTRDVLPVNSHWLPQSRDLILEAIRQSYRPLPTNRHGVMISTTIQLGRSLDPRSVVEALQLQDAGLPDGSVSLQPWYPPIWMPPSDDRMSTPVAAPLIAKHQEIQLTPPENESSVRLPQLSPDFLEFTRSRPGWVNVVRTRYYGENNTYAEAMPSATLIDSDRYPPRSHVFQIPTREGHLTFHDFSHDGTSFVLTTMQDAIFGWLGAHGIEAKPSDAGRVAEQVIASVGGLTGAVLLAHPEAIQQFDNMARSRATRSDGNSEEFPARTATIGQLTAMMQKISKKLWGRHLTLERFIDAGVLQLGISVRCSHCTKENWYSLDDIAFDIRCERCLKTFSYPQGKIPNRGSWKYRVIGPFATPHFAQGGYSVALTLRFLQNEIGSMEEFTYSTSLELTCDDKQFETDFFAWHAKHPFTRAARDPVLLVGECKSFGAELFKKADLDRLKQLGELLPGAYLVVSTLKRSLGASEARMLRSLARWGWKRARSDRPPSRVIVLTGTELFAIGPLSKAWEEAGGELLKAAQQYSYIFDFDTLAQATQQAHLGFTNEEMHSMRYSRPRKGPPPHAQGIKLAL